MTNEAIVLAGGLGTRLRSVIQDVPKPMAEVAGRPFLDYILYSLKKNNIKKVVFAVSHKYEVIQDYYKDSRNSFGIEISYSIEKELLGTGGAIYEASQQILGDSFFILNGDTYFEIDLSQLHTFAKETSADLALALKMMPHSDRYGSVVCANDHKIVSFKEKEPGKKQDLLINGGIYHMNKRVIEILSMPSKFSFEIDFLQRDLNKISAYGKLFDETFIDIGIPEDYEYAQSLLKNVIP
ncbi:nucleotidyltransferase family protein [Rufibacter glacialis]|uniref:NTP transferase domain-containing protein n=1 Tax=Rufibacter glacialis TaxID=1259555 RepID=A0A5M8Q8X8_9BACT|nr:nucleotidyltransferase family protein [Rufibacter glacialis]KAA6432387.1 NTP transferase domain-containing protein [Rufibacter glacialis]GGK78230.1 D-glycero-D-manno-heptose 1-phosphate guanosyltransferase [Rufibacter glacialis]